MLGLSPKTDIRLISAMIAFSMFEAAYYSEIIRAGIQSISRGQSSAALALGMTHWQSMKLVILPQAFRAMVPLLLTQGIVLFQDTSLVYVLSLADFSAPPRRLANVTEPRWRWCCSQAPYILLLASAHRCWSAG